jgi:serpin B
VRYRQGAGYQAVTLPYLGTELAMAVILPDQRDGLADLESGLSAAMIGDCLQTPVSTRVELSLPRFHIHWGTDELGDVLAALGMTLALGGEADFSGINGRAPPDEAALFISGVVHKAFVDVDEQGTEAAASTLLMQTVLGLSPRVAAVPVFRADHPFLFAIGDPDSGAILFLGRMVDPSLAT